MLDARSDRIIGSLSRAGFNLPYRRRPFKAMISFITLVAFLSNIICYDIAWSDRTPSELTSVGSDNRAVSPVSPGVFKELNVRTFAFPQALGTVKDSWTPAVKGQKPRATVIHIQDAHCNYDAQHTIANIIEYVSNEYGISQINLEGGAKDYDLSVFTGIKDKSVRERVVDYFVREGVVNGAEYFAVNNPEKASLWGIEDIKLYIQNLKVYRDSLEHKADIDRLVKNLSYILTNLKMKIYSKELLAMDLKYNQYKAGNIEFNDYLNYLVANSKDKMIDMKSFPDIFLLNQVMKEERDIDFSKANTQRDELIDKLQKKLSKSDMKELVAKTVEFKAGIMSQEEFYRYLLNKAKSAGVSVENFPELEKYIVYISSYAAIDKAKVMDEITVLETRIRETLYQNEKQRSLDKLSRDLAILKNIFNISLTRADYKYYKENKDAFDMKNYSSLIEREAPLYNINAKLDDGIGRLDDYRADIEKFYVYSFKRDDAFMKNIKFEGQGEKGKDKGMKSAIVVTGGFHTENLCEQFKKQGIAYISIIPNFKNAEGYECPYFNMLAGKQTTLDSSLNTLLSSSLAPPDIWTMLGAQVEGENEVMRESIKAAAVKMIEELNVSAVRLTNGASSVAVVMGRDGSLEATEDNKGLQVCDVSNIVNKVAQLPAAPANVAAAPASSAVETAAAKTAVGQALTEKLNSLTADELREQMKTAFESGAILRTSLFDKWSNPEYAVGLSKVLVAGVFVLRKINGEWCLLLGQRGEGAKDNRGVFSGPVGKVDKPVNLKYESANQIERSKRFNIQTAQDIVSGRETVAGAAVRELSEEVPSFKLTIDNISGRIDDFFGDDDGKLINFFVYVDNTDTVDVAVSKEFVNPQWIPIGELLNATAETAGESVENYLKNKFPETRLMHGLKRDDLGGIRNLRQLLIQVLEKPVAPTPAPSAVETAAAKPGEKGQAAKPSTDRGEPKTLRAGTEIYGLFYPKSGEIVIDLKKAREALRLYFGARFAGVKEKIDALSDNELKGLIHCHEIFHQLENLADMKFDEESANIFAMKAMGLRLSNGEEIKFKGLISRIENTRINRKVIALIIRQLKLLYKSPEFLLNLNSPNRLGVDILKITAGDITAIPEGARAMAVGEDAVAELTASNNVMPYAASGEDIRKVLGIPDNENAKLLYKYEVAGDVYKNGQTLKTEEEMAAAIVDAIGTVGPNQEIESTIRLFIHETFVNAMYAYERNEFSNNYEGGYARYMEKVATDNFTPSEREYNTKVREDSFEKTRCTVVCYKGEKGIVIGMINNTKATNELLNSINANLERGPVSGQEEADSVSENASKKAEVRTLGQGLRMANLIMDLNVVGGEIVPYTGDSYTALVMNLPQAVLQKAAPSTAPPIIAPGNVVPADVNTVTSDKDKVKQNALRIEIGGKDVFIDNALLAEYAKFGFDHEAEFVEYFKEYFEMQFDIEPPKENEIVVGILDASSSPAHLLEQHMQNGFAGVMRKLVDSDITTELRKKLFMLDLEHKMAHEVGMDNEARLFEEDVSYAENLNITAREIDALCKAGLMESDSKFINELKMIERVAMACRSMGHDANLFDFADTILPIEMFAQFIKNETVHKMLGKSSDKVDMNMPAEATVLGILNHLRKKAAEIALASKNRKLSSKMAREMLRDLRVGATELEARRSYLNKEIDNPSKDILANANYNLYKEDFRRDYGRVVEILNDLAILSEGDLPVNHITSEGLRVIISRVTDMTQSSAAIYVARKNKPQLTIEKPLIADNLIIDVNETWLESALLNLVKNAAIFAKTKVQIKVNVISESGKNYLKIDVIDDGDGIKKSIEPYIGDLNATDREGGSGLGAAIARAVMQLTPDARFAYETRRVNEGHADHGTTFSLLIPTVSAEIKLLEPAAASETAPAKSLEAQPVKENVNAEVVDILSKLIGYGINPKDTNKLTSESSIDVFVNRLDKGRAEIKNLLLSLIKAKDEILVTVEVFDEGDNKEHSVYVITADGDTYILQVGDKGVFAKDIANVAAPTNVNITRRPPTAEEKVVGQASIANKMAEQIEGGTADWIIVPEPAALAMLNPAQTTPVRRGIAAKYKNSETYVKGYAYNAADLPSEGYTEDTFKAGVAKTLDAFVRYVNDEANKEKDPRAIIYVPVGKYDLVINMLKGEEYSAIKNRVTVIKENVPDNGLIHEVLHVDLGKALLNYERREEKKTFTQDQRNAIMAYIKAIVPQGLLDAAKGEDILKAIVEGRITLEIIAPIDIDKNWRKHQEQYIKLRTSV